MPKRLTRVALFLVVSPLEYLVPTDEQMINIDDGGQDKDDDNDEMVGQKAKDVTGMMQKASAGASRTQPYLLTDMMYL